MTAKLSKRDIKIAVLETKLTQLGIDIEEIKTNHLVHINDRLDKIEKIMYKGLGGLAVLIILLQIVLPIILK